jgi:acetyl esterase/lipase
LQKELSKSASFSVVVPAYTLAPKGQYPTQLKQAAETLAWLLKQGKKPDDVSILTAFGEKSKC